MAYMTHEDPRAFEGMAVRAQPTTYPPGPHVLCPKCGGHGGWHLQLDAYGPGRHFNAGCNQCNGWGWVTRGGSNESCIHEFGSGRNVGRCLNEYTCTTCGYERIVDSSD